MKKIKLVSIFIFSFFLGAEAQTKLENYEYWFNGDYSNKQVVAPTPTTQHQLELNIDASALPDGVNILNIRYKDENSLYSSTLSKVFYKNTETLVPDKKLQAYELWFNSDFGNKQVVAITPATEHQLVTNMDVSDLPDGINVLNIRYKDENGLFSSTLSKVFYKNTETLVPNKKLTEYELWFNSDYENKQKFAITPAAQHQLVTNLDASALPEGVNVLNIRYKDENNRYSSTLSKVFFKSGSVLTNNKITAYRYWFDDDFGNAVHTALETPVEEYSLTDDLDASGLPMGKHTVHFQFLDSYAMWSVVTTDSLTKTAIPLAAFSVSGSNLCSGSAVQFVNESIDTDTWLWDFGDGTTSADFEPEHIFADAGDYEVSLTATDSESGIEDIIIQTITINPAYETEESIEICEGEAYTWNGLDYTETGSYNEVLTSVNGCDSVVTLNLQVNPVYDVMYSGDDAIPDYLVNETFEEIPLNTFPDDWIIRYKGTDWNDHYVVDDPVKNGIHALKVSGSDWAANLSKPVENIPDNVVLESWIRAENVVSGGRCGLGIGNPEVGSWGAYWGRVEFFEGNLITFYYTGNSGGYGTQYILQSATSSTWYHIRIEADAAAATYKVYINGEQASSNTGGQTITEFPLYTSIQATSVEIYGNSLVYFDDIKMYENGNPPVTICASEVPYIFGEQELTESGTYTETFQTIHGCDSVVALNLIVNPVYNHTETAAICEGESYEFGGTAYTESGEYSHTFPSVNGCDSVVTLTLTVNPVTYGTDLITACDNYTWIDGVTYTESNYTATDTITNTAGCDSVVTLNLTINHSTTGTDVITACDSYTWIDGVTYTESNYTATDTITNTAGCDSVVTLNLTINHSTTGTDVITACDSYTWIDGITYTESNYTETDTITNAAGCDSVVTLNLTINPVYNHTETASICAGESYDFGGTAYTESGEYTHTFTSVNGCDSVVTLTLTVNPLTYGTDVITACESYTWIDGVTYTESNNTATHTLTNVAGCDSVITLNLTINPVYNHTETASICDGESYDSGGTTYTESGEYIHTFTSVNGCDSVVTLTLTLNPVYDETVEVTIHEDELPYIFGGESLDESGVYTKTFASVAGCDSTVTLTLTVLEYSVPVAVCNPISIYLNETGNYTLSVADLENIAAGSNDAHTAFADLVISVTPDAFTCSDAGNDVDVMVIVTNEDNYADTCYTTVSVADNIAPQVDCRDLEVYLDENGEAVIDVNEMYADAWDACGIKKITTYKEVFTCADLGNNYFSASVTDFNRNKKICQNLVTVIDTISPAFLPVTDTEVSAPAGESSATIDYPDIVATDNCEIENLFLYEGLGPDSKFPVGTTTERWVAVDASGNSDTLSFAVHVAGNEPPLIVQPVQDMEMKAGDTLKVFFNAEKGIIFDDGNEDDVLYLSLRMADEGTLPEWLTFRNDSLLAFPAVADTGCINLLLVATDLSGEEVNSPFMLCVDFPVGTNLLTNQKIKIYPNPTTGKVYIGFSEFAGRKADVTVLNVLGQQILRKNFYGEGRWEIDLSNQVNGMYLLKISGNGIELNHKIILNRED